MTQNSINSKQPLIQYVSTLSTGAVIVNASIPKDNTIPQSGEGVEIITCSITPTNASNLLIITVNLFAMASAQNDFVLALFQDATANAIATMEGQYMDAAGWVSSNVFSYAMVAGTTSATTFKIRGGRTNASDVTVNVAEFGGVQTMYMEIMEVKA